MSTNVKHILYFSLIAFRLICPIKNMRSFSIGISLSFHNTTPLFYKFLIISLRYLRSFPSHLSIFSIFLPRSFYLSLSLSAVLLLISIMLSPSYYCSYLFSYFPAVAPWYSILIPSFLFSVF